MSRRDRPELAEIESFALHLDAQTDAGDAPRSTGALRVPDDLAATARVVHAASGPRGLSRRFADRLEENLMDLAALDRPVVDTHAPPPSRTAPPVRRVPASVPAYPPPALRHRRGVGGFVSFTVLIGLVAAIFAQTLGPGGQFAFWRATTPAPAPSGPASGLGRVDAGRTGSYAEVGPTGLPGLRWIADNAAAPGVFIQPIASDGALFVADYFGREITRVLPDGSTAGSVSRSTVLAFVVDGDTVIVASGEGESASLGAYGDGDGTERWSVATGETAAELGYDGERVFLVDRDGILHAFAVADGAETWTVDLDVENQNSIFQPPSFVVNDATPAVAGGLLVVGTAAGVVRAFSADDGTPRWTFDPAEQIIGAPTIAGGAVYVATRQTGVNFTPGAGRVYALDGATGTERWAYAQPAWTNVVSKITAVSAVDVLVLTTEGSRVYVNGDGETGDAVTALDAATGRAVWSTSFGVASGAAPVVAGDTLHLTRPDGGVYGLNAETGKQRWRLDAGTAALESPVVLEDLLLITTSEGTVIGLSDHNGDAASSATPAAGGDADDISGRAPCVAPRLRPDPLPTGEPARTLDLLQRTGGQGQGWLLHADVPTEPLADAAARLGIVDTLRAMQACDRPGKERQLGGFFTDDYYRHIALSYPDADLLTLPWVAHVPYSLETITLDALPAPVMLADGRVALLVWHRQTREGQLIVFVEAGGSWLVDEVVRVTEEPDQPMG